MEKKRQFRAMDPKNGGEKKNSSDHGMIFDKESVRRDRNQDLERHEAKRRYSRSRSPRSHDRYRARTSPRGERKRNDWDRGYGRDKYVDRDRRR